MSRFTLIALAAIALSSTACGDPAAETRSEVGHLSEPACVTLASTLGTADAWRDGLEPLDPAPRASVASPGSTIRLWVSPDALDAYRGMADDATAFGPDFPRGGVVVREMFDATGARTAITATCRAQAGYDPAVEDLWFAKVDPDRADAAEMGRLPSCGGCHQYNTGTQGLYGPLTAE